MDIAPGGPLQNRIINYLARQNESSSGLSSIERDLAVDSKILHNTLVEMNSEGIVQYSGAWGQGGYVRLIEDSV